MEYSKFTAFLIAGVELRALLGVGLNNANPIQSTAYAFCLVNKFGTLL